MSASAPTFDAGQRWGRVDVANMRLETGRILQKDANAEAVMAELSGQQAAEVRPTAANNNVMDFMFGAQRLMLGEIPFAGNELLDRARTETHLFSEFVSKLAGAHSVNGLKTMYEEYGQHQVDFIRRDYERLFKHGKRMIEATWKLFSNQPDG
jgi:hypothetical protein